jgi:hypothetical protein
MKVYNNFKEKIIDEKYLFKNLEIIKKYCG